ncbi:hypothetical protein CPB86DRAFT_281618 [Serendipita vermifera]|nr:hypothetical protein CPB86DRAFT_281618 [Serendipita vermifera]
MQDGPRLLISCCGSTGHQPSPQRWYDKPEVLASRSVPIFTVAEMEESDRAPLSNTTPEDIVMVKYIRLGISCGACSLRLPPQSRSLPEALFLKDGIPYGYTALFIAETRTVFHLVDPEVFNRSKDREGKMLDLVMTDTMFSLPRVWERNFEKYYRLLYSGNEMVGSIADC